MDLHNQTDSPAAPAWLERGRPLSELLRRPPRSMCWALAFLALGLGVRWLLAPWLDPSPFLTFYPAVIAAALFCGWRSGAAVLLLSAAFAHYFFIDPKLSWSFRDAAAVVLVVCYLATGALMLWLVAALTDAVRRLDACVAMQETLFRELQHRVANNMQIVASTLRAVERGLQDQAAREAIAHATARVGSLAKLHRRLYEPSAHALGLEALLRDVLAETFRDLSVKVELDVRAVRLSASAMTAVVLLVNEAAINACKHVFRPGRGAHFVVRLCERADGAMELVVRDDGPGLPPPVPCGLSGQRLGMTIMQSFARQLGGTLERLEGPGAGLSVSFQPD